MREVQLLVENGLTKEQFETTRDFLIHYSKLWVQTQSRRLGYVMDSEFYGIPYYVDYIAKQLSALTVDDVNAAIKRHLQAKNYYLSIVAKDAVPLEKELLSNDPSPIQYNNPNVPEEILAQDKVIEVLPININQEKFRIVPWQIYLRNEVEPVSRIDGASPSRRRIDPWESSTDEAMCF